MVLADPTSKASPHSRHEQFLLGTRKKPSNLPSATGASCEQKDWSTQHLILSWYYVAHETLWPAAQTELHTKRANSLHCGTHKHMLLHTHTHTHTRAHTHTRTHTHTHTHTHRYMHALSKTRTLLHAHTRTLRDLRLSRARWRTQRPIGRVWILCWAAWTTTKHAPALTRCVEQGEGERGGVQSCWCVSMCMHG